MNEKRRRRLTLEPRQQGVRLQLTRSTVAQLSAIVSGLWLCLDIISNTAADIYATRQPETALAWVRNHPTALVTHAGRQLESDTGELDKDAIVALVRHAVRSDPLQAGALRVLGFAVYRGGDGSQAEALMRLAGERSLRDFGAQSWLFARRLTGGDYEAALVHLDAILRVWPRVSDRFLGTLVGLANHPDGQIHLIERLKHNPPWREWLLQHLPKETPSPERLYALYSALESADTPLTIDELRPYLRRLIAIGAYSTAYVMQVEFLPDERIATLGLLNNGGFDLPLTDLPFDWTIANARGALTEIVVDNKANRALRVKFHNTRVPYRHFAQLLLLRPGSYRLVGQVKPVNLRNDRGMQWVISCTGKNRQRLGASERTTGNGGWARFEMSFDVPDSDDCEAQEIRLVLAARISAEQQASGEIWYDDLQIERSEATMAPPSGTE